jgi:hypothetical protein
LRQWEGGSEPAAQPPSPAGSVLPARGVYKTRQDKVLALNSHAFRFRNRLVFINLESRAVLALRAVLVRQGVTMVLTC